MASQIPPLLEPYLSLPPEASQIVLTGVLGASTNWLVLRTLYSLLGPAAGRTPRRGGVGGDREDEEEDGDGDGGVKVLLVSFMRDFSFWKDGAGRLGLNLDALAAQGRFYFVDGLSRLFLGGPAGAAAPSPPPASSSSSAAAAAAASGAHGGYLESARAADVARALAEAVTRLQATRRAAGRVVLVLDQPDVLLAAAGGDDGVTGTALGGVVLGLREKVHAAVVALAADEPLLSAQATALEREHAAFVLSLAHEAEAVLSLRLLDTGAAKDVSGVVRITRGGGAVDGAAVEEHEYLYHVGGDGGVKVFERGQ